MGTLMTDEKQTAREDLILNHAMATKRNAAEMSGMPITVIVQHFREFAEALSALDQPSGVRVRKLEWEYIDGDWVARPESGPSYTISQFRDGWDLLINGNYVKPYRHGFRETSTLEAAQAAAQAGYEARILSALDLSAIGAEGSAPNQNFETLVADAKRAATALYDWTCVNEAEWAGWGECEVPPGAKFWRVKAGQAVKALDELPSPPEPRS